jgi:hypothetical protein
VLAFNEFAFGTVALKPTPWGIVPKGEWTDHEDRLATEWLQKQGILVSVDIAGQAVQPAARDHPFHPVKAYLQSLKWDGYGLRACRWIAVADFSRRANLSFWREGRLLSHSGRPTGNPKIHRPEDPRWRVLH